MPKVISLEKHRARRDAEIARRKESRERMEKNERLLRRIYYDQLKRRGLSARKKSSASVPYSTERVTSA
jgi:hypothetical protein